MPRSTIAKSITIGEVKIYGAAPTERGGIEKKDQVDTKLGFVSAMGYQYNLE